MWGTWILSQSGHQVPGPGIQIEKQIVKLDGITTNVLILPKFPLDVQGVFSETLPQFNASLLPNTWL